MTLPSPFATIRTWWDEGRPIVPLRWVYKGDGLAKLSWFGKFLNAYSHHTRWLRWSWWSYVWRAPQHWPRIGRTYRDWDGLDRWEVRWCRLRGHPGTIYFNPGGMEPDNRCKRCLEEIA